MATTARTDRVARVRTNCLELQEEARNGEIKELRHLLHMFDALAGEVAKLAEAIEPRLTHGGRGDV